MRFDVLQDFAVPERDLASGELWDRSLYRSRQRRRLTEVGRKSRRRRKSASLATTAALAAVPVVPQTLAAAEVPGSGPSVAGSVDSNGAALSAAAQRVVLQEGSQGALVTALQRRLNEVLPLAHIAVDGVFGPQTRGAVVDFQRREGLPASGAVDARSWAVLFKAPVLVFGGMAAGGSGSDGSAPPSTTAASASGAVQNVSHASRAPATGGGHNASGAARSMQSRHVGGPGTVNGPRARASDSSGMPIGGGPSRSVGGPSRSAGGPADAGTPSNNSGPAIPSTPSTPRGSSNSSSGSRGAPPVAVVAPAAPPKQSSTYVLTGGVALPLPRQYITGGYVDQGVDYAAPGGTPEYAMGDGVIIGEGISGFGPNAPILKITDGPLKGMEIYYGHAGPNLVHVGQQVHAGQQITIVGYGIVGISTGPHLEVGFYPPGSMGAGSRMLSLINSMMSQHSSGRAWGPGGGVLARTTRRGARLAHARRRHRSVMGYSATGGGTGGTSAAPAAVSSAPAGASSTAPAAVPTAAPAAPAAVAVAPTASSVPAPAPDTAAPAAPAPVSAAPEPTQSAPVDSAPTVPTGESATTPTPADGAPSQSAPAPDSTAGGSGSTSTTPAGSSGVATATTPAGALQTTGAAQAPVSKAPAGVGSAQPQQEPASAPAQAGPASAATGSASASGPATAGRAPTEAISHGNAAPSGVDASPSEAGAPHGSAR